MASAARSLRLVCRSCRSSRPTRHVSPKVFVAWKSVAGGAAFRDVKLSDAPAKPTPWDHWEEEDKAEDLKYRNKRPSQVLSTILADEEGPDAIRGLDAYLPSVDDGFAAENDKLAEWSRPLRTIVKPKRDAFWDDEEPDNDLITNDDNDEFQEDDITDVAHAKLEEHREQRAYARIAIWEMPLLASE